MTPKCGRVTEHLNFKLTRTFATYADYLPSPYNCKTDINDILISDAVFLLKTMQYQSKPIFKLTAAFRHSESETKESNKIR